MRILLVAWAACLVAVACANADAPPEVLAREVAAQVWSPYCPGRLLTDCSTQQARELRVDIERRLRAGATQAEVLDELRANYGDESIATPLPGPLGSLLWAVPLAALIVGAVVTVISVRRWTASQRSPAPASGNVVPPRPTEETPDARTDS